MRHAAQQYSPYVHKVHRGPVSVAGEVYEVRICERRAETSWCFANRVGSPLGHARLAATRLVGGDMRQLMVVYRRAMRTSAG